MRVTDLIRNEDVNRRLLRLEELMAGTHFEKSASTLTPETLAARTAGLWNDWKGELGEYPDPETVAAVLRSRRFITLRSLNWGVLTSDKPNPKGTPFRARLYAEVVHEHRLRQQTQKPQVFNAADAHAARVEELKREAVRLPIPADEYDRLPRWLQHKVLAEWDDPTVRDWVAEELAKPERETPTLSDDCPGDERERPLGYGYDACEIENQLHALA